eukprot:gnl/TRDRNA2_/TRDRNA2_142535_c0_seq1.p1 gnl/TRDRNA2_/TRDRNA2_142535_c0~~gnl/TRDRNA2_/TRDRNA2_142535_c0_seq1.p1  ORF type:complete len:1091 (+),score=168.48 gnl/TRDRNA2_/TRDRNA2_142535_c0_seq1:90-3362(+)
MCGGVLPQMHIFKQHVLQCMLLGPWSLAVAYEPINSVQVRLGWVMPPADVWPPARIDLACAVLAVDAVNKRDGTVSGSLAALRHNFTFVLAGNAILTGSKDTWADQVESMAQKHDIDVLLMDTWSTHSVEVADHLNVMGIPGLQLVATSPLFNEFPEKQWFQFFRMYPTCLTAVQRMGVFMNEAGWTHAAVLFTHSDTWSSSLASAVAGLGLVADMYPLSADSDAVEDAAAIRTIQLSGVKVVVLLFFGRRKDELCQLLQKNGMLGSSPHAHGWVLLTISENDQNYPEGALIFGNNIVDVSQPRLHALQEQWSARLPTLNLKHLGGLRITAAERRMLTADMVYVSCYDAVVAVAVATDSLLSKAGSLANPRRDITKALAAGVSFEGLLPYTTRAGHPWADPVREGPVLNVLADRQVATVHSPHDVIFPGKNHQLPVSFVPTPCSGAKCGLGECVVEKTLGRAAGWCRCPPGIVGSNCSLRASMNSRPQKDNFSLQVDLQAAKLVGFSDTSDEYHMELDLKMSFVDTRLALLSGAYNDLEIAELVNDNALWLPDLLFPHFSRLSQTRTMNVSGSHISLTLGLVATGFVQLDWQLFPFDSHEVIFKVQLPPLVGWQLPLPARDRVAFSSTGQWLLRDGDEHPAGFYLGIVDQFLVGSFMVHRNIRYFVLRIFVPSFVLVVVSWAGFFIKPTALMPRFASGFISFLALNQFMGLARSEMPSKLSKLCWMDIYMNSIGLLMGLAIIENITAQYLFEHYSESLAKSVDQMSRFAFPSIYVFIVVILSIAQHDQFLGLALSHSFLAAFFMVAVAWIAREILLFPSLVLRRAIHLNSRYRSTDHPQAKELPWLHPTTRELGFIFAAVDVDHNGSLSVDEIQSWVTKNLRPRLTENEHKELVNELYRHFGDGDVKLPGFEVAFTHVIKAIAFARRGSVYVPPCNADPSTLASMTLASTCSAGSLSSGSTGPCAHKVLPMSLQSLQNSQGSRVETDLDDGDGDGGHLQAAMQAHIPIRAETIGGQRMVQCDSRLGQSLPQYDTAVHGCNNSLAAGCQQSTGKGTLLARCREGDALRNDTASMSTTSVGTKCTKKATLSI